MNQKKLGIVVIIKNKFIKGLVTDGDLRRDLKNNSINKDVPLLPVPVTIDIVLDIRYFPYEIITNRTHF